MTLRDEIEAALIRVYFAPRNERLAKEQADAVVEVLKRASAKEIKELIA